MTIASGIPPMRISKTACATALLLATFVPVARAAWPPAGLGVCTESHTQRNPQAVSDGSRGAIVVWTDARFGNDDLFAQRVDSSGVVRWSANGVAVCTEPHTQGPHAVVPYSGGAVVYWQDSRSGEDDIYGQRMSDLGLPLWTFNGVPVATGPDQQVSPVVVPDDASPSFTTPGQIVLWRRGVSGDAGWFLNVQRVGSGGALLWSGGTSGVPLLPASTVLNGVVLASDGISSSVFGPRGAVAAWYQHAVSSTVIEVRARRVSYAGVPQWAAGGVSLCALPGIKTDLAIAAVGGGNTMVAWVDGRDTDANLYAQKLDMNGVPQWLANGVPVCRAATMQGSTCAVSDGVGGAIVAWADSRTGASQVYAQRLDGGGQVLWALDGVTVGPSPSSQYQPELVADGAGGAIVVWGDSLPGGDLYAQRLDPNGSRLWPAPGVRLTTGARRNSFISAVGDGAFGVLAAWSDYRTQVNDIYATRLTGGAGFLDVPQPMAGAGLALAPPAPNPARGETAVRYSLPHAASASVALYDVTGRRVRLLFDGDAAAGEHVLPVPVADDAGRRLPAGVYLVRMECEGRAVGRRLVVLR